MICIEDGVMVADLVAAIEEAVTAVEVTGAEVTGVHLEVVVEVAEGSVTEECTGDLPDVITTQVGDFRLDAY